MSLALSLCQYVLRPWRGLAQASPGLAWLRPGLGEPRSASIASLHQHKRKGKIVMIKTRRYKRLVFGFVFCTWNWYDFWRRSWGLPCNSDRCHGEMYFDIVLVYCHQNQKKGPAPQTGDKNTTEETEGEGQAIQRVARIVRHDRPVMGLPCWPLKKHINQCYVYGYYQSWVSHVGNIR